MVSILKPVQMLYLTFWLLDLSTWLLTQSNEELSKPKGAKLTKLLQKVIEIVGKSDNSHRG